MTIDTNATRLHVLAQGRARERAGKGWRLLSSDLREALVAREALLIIVTNADVEGYGKAAALGELVVSQEYS